MSVPNFSFLACLEVAEKLVLGVGGVEHVASMSNLNPSYVELLLVELSWVELGFDNLRIDTIHELKESRTTSV